jgi:hypothetical protein
MKRTGLGDAYVPTLKPWRDARAAGLTPFPEMSDPTRSDCHAWSASPGCRTVRIEPNLGPPQRGSGRVAHPAGLIEVRFERSGDGLDGEVEPPEGISGVLSWKGASAPLHGGRQHVHVTASGR